MYTPIQIIPRIRSLTLENVGCWPLLHMEFHPGINVITGALGALGKTTILKAILRGAWPSCDDKRLAPREGSEEGRIEIEFAPRRTVLRRKRDLKRPPWTASRDSHGQKMLLLLQERIGAAGECDALLFDDEVFGALDDAHRSKAAELLNESLAQVVCVIKRLNRDDFPKARIFACAWDRDKDVAKMRLLQ